MTTNGIDAAIQAVQDDLALERARVSQLEALRLTPNEKGLVISLIVREKARLEEVWQDHICLGTTLDEANFSERRNALQVIWQKL